MPLHTSVQDTTNYLSQKYLQVNSCGKEAHSHEDYHVFRRNGRLDHLLLYVVSGKYHVEYDGKNHELAAGDFVHYLPNEKQNYWFLKGENACGYFLHYTGNEIESILEELHLGGGVYHFSPSRKITAAFDEIVSEYELSPPLHEQAKSALLLTLLTQLARLINYSHLRSSKINEVIRLMQANYMEEYDVNTYADYCALSPGRFGHKFKESTGLSPLQYFINIKLEKAKELLAFSDLNISEVAEQVGYDNPLYFSRQFKAQLGVSPMSYRKSLQSEKESR